MDDHNAFSKEFKRQKKVAREAANRQRRATVAEQKRDFYGAHRWRAEPGSELARLRMKVHRTYDALWEFDIMSRTEMYRRLSAALDLPREITHIGMFDEVTCVRALQVRSQIND